MDLAFLSSTPLFRGTAPEEILQMLQCLNARERAFEKGSVICRAGDTADTMGLILSGHVRIENDDFWGNRSILDRLEPGQVFAESYACLRGEPLMVNVVAGESVRVLFLNMSRLLRTCPDACAHHSKLICNLLSVSAQKNLALSRRIFHTSHRTIRGRLLSYLSYQAKRQGTYRFSIPFDRQQLADYLGVDRSALSAELGKMRREGMLRFEKNRFELLGG